MGCSSRPSPLYYYQWRAGYAMTVKTSNKLLIVHDAIVVDHIYFGNAVN